MKLFFKKNYDYLIITILTSLALFIPFDFSPMLFSDSGVYLAMHPKITPMYPVWLSIFRSIFGQDIYLNIVILVQTILAILSVILLFISLRSSFKFANWLSFILWPLVMYPFFCNISDGVIYPRCILTEGLSYPLFYCYLSLTIYLLLYKKNHKESPFPKLSLLGLFMLSGVISIFRGQLKLTLVFNCILAFILLLQYKKAFFKQIVLVSVLGLILALSFIKFTTFAYTSLKFGKSFTPEFANTSMMINFLYAVDREDQLSFADDEDAEFINMVFDDTFSSSFTYDNRGNTIASAHDHLMDANLYLKLHMYIPYAETYYADRGLDQVEIYQKYEDISLRMLKELAPRHFTQWLNGVLALMLYGISEIVFFRYPPLLTFCYAFSVFILVFAIALSIYALKKKRATAQATFMLLVTAMVLLNHLACCLAIGAIARYMAYFFGTFYVAGVLLLYELIFKADRP